MKYINILVSIFAVTALAAPPLAAREEAVPEMTRYYGKDIDEVTVEQKREEAVPEMTRYYGKDIDEITGTAE
jgi:hypothetical protein